MKKRIAEVPRVFFNTLAIVGMYMSFPHYAI